MVQVGVREFKNGASRFFERVEAGEVVTVTKRGKPVARVFPAGIPAGVAELMAAGKVRWGGGKPSLPTPIVLSGDGPSASDYVIEGRR